MIQQMKGVIRRLFARPRFQGLWRWLHRLSLIGMNVNVPTLSASGERQVIELLHRLPRSSTPLMVFDVGAHVGRYAQEVCERLGEQTQVHCFEPSAATFAQLRENVATRSNVQAWNVGFSDTPHEAKLHTIRDGSELASLYDRRLAHHNTKMSQRESVRLTTVDEFCRATAIDRIDLLKLDVEGHEFQVLTGARQMLVSGAIGLIQFEFGGTNIDSRTFLQDFFYLLSDQFKLYRILQLGYAPILKYSEEDELFMATNYLAVRNDLIGALARQ